MTIFLLAAGATPSKSFADAFASVESERVEPPVRPAVTRIFRPGEPGYAASWRREPNNPASPEPHNPGAPEPPETVTHSATAPPERVYGPRGAETSASVASRDAATRARAASLAASSPHVSRGEGEGEDERGGTHVQTRGHARGATRQGVPSKPEDIMAAARAGATNGNALMRLRPPQGAGSAVAAAAHASAGHDSAARNSRDQGAVAFLEATDAAVTLRKFRQAPNPTLVSLETPRTSPAAPKPSTVTPAPKTSAPLGKRSKAVASDDVHDVEAAVPQWLVDEPRRSGRTTRSSARISDDSDAVLPLLKPDEAAQALFSYPYVAAPAPCDEESTAPAAKSRVESIAVTRGDVRRLQQPREYLNDSLIDWYLQYLVTRYTICEQQRADTYVFTSFFYKKLSHAHRGFTGTVAGYDAAYANVSGWTRDVDIFTKKFVLVPINMSMHWSLAVICNLPSLDIVLGEWSSRRGTAEISTPSAGGAKRGHAYSAHSESTQEYEDTAEPSGRKKPRTTRVPDAASSESDDDVVLVDERKPEVRRRRKDEDFLQETHEWSADDAIPCIVVLDSLRMHDHKAIGNELQNFVLREWQVRRNNGLRLGKDKQITVDPDCMPVIRPKAPQQSNSYDCGLFVLDYARQWIVSCHQRYPEAAPTRRRSPAAASPWAGEITERITSHDMRALIDPEWFPESRPPTLRQHLLKLAEDLQEPDTLGERSVPCPEGKYEETVDSDMPSSHSLADHDSDGEVQVSFVTEAPAAQQAARGRKSAGAATVTGRKSSGTVGHDAMSAADKRKLLAGAATARMRPPVASSTTTTDVSEPAPPESDAIPVGAAEGPARIDVTRRRSAQSVAKDAEPSSAVPQMVGTDLSPTDESARSVVFSGDNSDNDNVADAFTGSSLQMSRPTDVLEQEHSQVQSSV